jgi:GR25 family glycosyltransferase involved in LPS biosynthesis
MVGAAGVQALGRSLLKRLIKFTHNIFLGDVCYNNCLERCFGKSYCPLEVSPDHYHTIACEAPPVERYNEEEDAMDAMRIAKDNIDGRHSVSSSSLTGGSGSINGFGVQAKTKTAAESRRLMVNAAAALKSHNYTLDGGIIHNLEQLKEQFYEAANSARGVPHIVDHDNMNGIDKDMLKSNKAAKSPTKRNRVFQKQTDKFEHHRAFEENLVNLEKQLHKDYHTHNEDKTEETHSETLRHGQDHTDKKFKVTEGTVEVIDATQAGDTVFDVRLNASTTFLHRGEDALKELAVAASHLKAIHQAYMAGEDFALILEEDASVTLLPLWHNIGLRESLEVVPKGWHVLQLHVWLGAEMGIGAKIVDKLQHRLQVGRIVSKRDPVKDYEFWGAVAYAVSRDGMEVLLKRYWGGWDTTTNRGIPKQDNINDQDFQSTKPLFEDPALPFLDLTENPLADIIVYTAPNTYVVNRPLFSHQLGEPHWTHTHQSLLRRHEDDRKRLLHFFYEDYEAKFSGSGVDDEDEEKLNYLMSQTHLWWLRVLDSFASNIAYLFDPSLLLIIVFYAHFCYAPIFFFWQSGRSAPTCCCEKSIYPERKFCVSSLDAGYRGNVHDKHTAWRKAHLSPSPSMDNFIESEIPLVSRRRVYSC